MENYFDTKSFIDELVKTAKEHTDKQSISNQNLSQMIGKYNQYDIDNARMKSFEAGAMWMGKQMRDYYYDNISDKDDLLTESDFDDEEEFDVSLSDEYPKFSECGFKVDEESGDIDMTRFVVNIIECFDDENEIPLKFEYDMGEDGWICDENVHNAIDADSLGEYIQKFAEPKMKEFFVQHFFDTIKDGDILYNNWLSLLGGISKNYWATEGCERVLEKAFAQLIFDLERERIVEFLVGS